MENKMNTTDDNLFAAEATTASAPQKKGMTVQEIVFSAPQVLFLDEPTVGQDNESLAALIEVLLHLNQTCHTALVCVSHDKRCIEALSDRIFRL